MQQPTGDSHAEHDIAQILEQIRNFHQDLLQDIETRRSWKLAMRNGAIGALGGILASALFFAFAVNLFAPLKHIDSLKPILERIAKDEDRGQNVH